MTSQKAAVRRTPPPLSVVMPVHNALPYLDEAIESILGQSFGDFEFVILDDGSTDGSTDRLRQWASKDSRISLNRVDENCGPAASSNRVVELSSAPLVARMDADDIAMPDRLAIQFDALRSCPELGLVGCLSDLIDRHGRIVRDVDLWRLTRRSPMVPFAHGTIMFRRRVFDDVGGYRADCDLWEDQDLVTRIAGVANVAVVPRLLYRVRQSSTSTRLTSDQSRQEDLLDRMYRNLRPRQGNGTIDPMVFVATGSVTLWSGGRPRLLRRFLRRSGLGLDSRTLAALLWTGWASLSPGSLRAVSRARLSIRNRIAARRLAGRDIVEWSPAGS